jgi:predicted nucleic acid-binding protein
VIVLDTKVISEMMREAPDRKVAAWIERAGRLHTTAVTLAEIAYGIARLPEMACLLRLCMTHSK